MDSDKVKGVYFLKDVKNSPDPVYSYSPNLCGTPLIIDNGSLNCRVGWATDSEPRLKFRNVYARQRKDRTKKPTVPQVQESELLVANDISNFESVRFLMKSPHDEDVVTHFEGQELLFDYAFSHMGIDSATVDHPVILTETLTNPNYSRQCMSELLFECYGVPKVAYCIDGLLSYRYNSALNPQTNFDHGVVINMGHWNTSIIPMVNQQMDLSGCRRIKMGGHHLIRYLWRWLQLRYPHHLNAITASRSEEILFNHSYIAKNYGDEINLWMDPGYYEKHVKKIQFPFLQPVVAQPVDPEKLKERKQEASRRLIECNARKREERYEEDQTELVRLTELFEALEEFSPEDPEYQEALEEAQVKSLSDLKKKIQTLNHRMEKVKLKMLQPPNPYVEEPKEPEEPKPSKLLAEAPTDKEELSKWLDDLKETHREIQSRKTLRKNKRVEMAKRRTAASQERMRIISQLAKREKKDDNFGMRDEDWDVYKAINKDGGGSDSEEDDDRLHEIESALRHHNPEFWGDKELKKLTAAEHHQLILSTEQIRITELLFQPSMYGIEQGGISATLDYVLKLYSPEISEKLVSNIFLTGSTSRLPGMKERIQSDLMSNRPFQSTFNINMAKSPELDPWYGAREMSSSILADGGISKSEYLECGPGYLKAHCTSNGFWSPKPALVFDPPV